MLIIDFLKKKNGELDIVKVSALSLVLFFLLTLVIVFFFVGEDTSSADINKDNLNIDTGIPAQHENVRLEKDRQVTYVTQNEVEKIVARAITDEMDKVHLEIDKNQKENLDTINQFQNKYDKKLKEQIESTKENLNQKLISNEQEIDLEKLKEKIIEDLNKENEKLKEEIKKLDNKISELENNKNSSSDNNSNNTSKNIELPSNSYAEEKEHKPKPEPEVKTKIVYRDRIVEKEPEPKPEPTTTFIPFTVEGIFTGQNNVAVINDNGRASNIKEGNNYKQFKFKKINDSSVEIVVDGREITVNLKDGGREF